MVKAAGQCFILCPQLHLTHCFLNCRAVFRNKERHFVRPNVPHNFLDQTHALEERYGVNNSVTSTFIQDHVWRHGNRFIARAVPEDNRQVKLLRYLDQIMENF